MIAATLIGAALLTVGVSLSLSGICSVNFGHYIAGLCMTLVGVGVLGAEIVTWLI